MSERTAVLPSLPLLPSGGTLASSATGKSVVAVAEVARLLGGTLASSATGKSVVAVAEVARLLGGTLASSATGKSVLLVPGGTLASSATGKTLPTPLLSVVVVNYCQWDNTAALVKQILRSPAARGGAVEVVVVDNHSPPHPVAARMRRWPGVSLRRWGRNRGFARAVNEGCRLSRGSWFLLLNPDLTMTKGFLEGVLGLAERLTAREERAGIVGFQLLNGDGSRQLSSGSFPTLPGTLTGLLQPRARRKYRSQAPPERCQVPWVTGCCLLIRRECLQELGGLDESFFLYYEDADLCRRARARGWSVWYEPKLKAIHHDPVHGRSVPPALRMITRHSLLTYSQQHWPGWQFRMLAGIVQLEAWAREVWAGWRGDEEGQATFVKMGKMAGDLWNGRGAAARRGVEKVVRAGDPRRISNEDHSPQRHEEHKGRKGKQARKVVK